MTGPGAEMPFLEHLEELRIRLIRALAAIVVGFGIGLWLVQRFQLVTLLKQPIAPYLASTGGKLAVLSPTDPVMIVLKLGFITGVVLASPIIIYQIWAFLAPALYDRERKAIMPALGFGLVLFLTGSALGYFYLLPQALRVLFSFQSEALARMDRCKACSSALHHGSSWLASNLATASWSERVSARAVVASSRA